MFMPGFESGLGIRASRRKGCSLQLFLVPAVGLRRFYETSRQHPDGAVTHATQPEHSRGGTIVRVTENHETVVIWVCGG